MSWGGLIKSEFKRLFSTLGWAILLGATILIALIWAVAAGSGLNEPKGLDARTADGVVGLLAGGSGVALFASLMAALLVTSEFRFHTAGSSMVESGSRYRWFLAKLPAALAAGLALSLVCQTVALLAGLPFLWRAGVHPDLLADGLPRAIAGSILVGIPAALWGAVLGLAVRSRVGTVLGLIVYTTMAETTVLAYLPSVGKWLPGGAQAAIVADPTMPYHSTALGIGVFAAWIMVVGAVALVRLVRTDVPM